MPSVFVAFGVTGDLMRLKILPALYALHAKGELPEDFRIIGVSRRAWGDEDLRAHVATIVGEAPAREAFLARLQFVQGDVADAALYSALAEVLGGRAAILYYSLSPALYASAFEVLARSPLAHAPLRLMLEKPFGTSGASARELNSILGRAFSEEQLYRVDHYLAKEALLDSPAVATANLARIEVVLDETLGVEARGASYDAVGALRDVGQNHMLECIAALVGGTNRAAALRDLTLPAQGPARLRRAQYEGYQEIVGVAPGSQTETAFQLELAWRHVPVVLHAGKRLPQSKKALRLSFTDGQQQEIVLGENRIASEYQRLMRACLAGEHELFVSAEENALLWTIIDPIVAAWEQGISPLEHYAPGTNPFI